MDLQEMVDSYQKVYEPFRVVDKSGNVVFSARSLLGVTDRADRDLVEGLLKDLASEEEAGDRGLFDKVDDMVSVMTEILDTVTFHGSLDDLASAMGVEMSPQLILSVFRQWQEATKPGEA